MSSGQAKSIYGEIHVECVIYNTDTLKFDIPKIIIIKNLGVTSIIVLGKLKQNELDIQYELLKSNIGDSAYYMLGKCFFIKSSKGWNEIARFDYHQIFFEPGPPVETPNLPAGACGAEQDGKGFEFGCWYIFYQN